MPEEKPDRRNETPSETWTADGVVIDAPQGADTPTTGQETADGEKTAASEKYAVYEEVARGGLGRVLRAEDLELGRWVAVKELLVQNPQAIERFAREARITALLEHPSIVPIHEMGVWPESGKPYYTMKLIEGRTLREAIAQSDDATARLSLLPRVLAVAEAVAYAHSKRIIHRDIKPSNIVLGEYGETMLVDWGLAKRLDDTEDNLPGRKDLPYRLPSTAGVTAAGAVLGTPRYMPPEQARGARVDERSDVYALGAVLYHTLRGQPPYASLESEAALGALLDGTAPREIGRSAPPELGAIVTRAMHQDPAQRYSNAGAFAEDLRRYLAGDLVRVFNYPFRSRVARWLRNHRALAITAALAIAVSGTVIVGSFLRVARERDDAREARSKAVRAAEMAVVERDRILLTQARSDVRRDPTRALHQLGYYTGEEPLQARAIAAWAVARGVSEAVLDGGTQALHVRVLKDGRILATGNNNELRFFDFAQASITTVATNALDYFALTPDRSQFAYVRGDELRLRKVASGQDLELGRTTGVAVLAIAPDGSRVFTGHLNGEVRAWSAPGESVVLTKHNGRVMFLEASAQEDLLVSTGADQVVRTVQWRSGATAARGRSYPWSRTAIRPQGDIAAWSPAGGGLMLYDLRANKPLFTVPGEVLFGPFAWSSDGRLLATAADGDEILVVDTLTRTVVLRHATSDRVYALEFSPTEQLLAYGDENGIHFEQPLSGGTARFALSSAVVDLRFATDGKHLVTSHGDGVLRQWKTPTEYARALDIGADRALAVEFSPNGKVLVAGGSEGVLRAWDTRTWASTELATGPSSLVLDLCFSASGHYLAATSTDGYAFVWSDLASPPARLSGHQQRAWQCGFVSDATLVSLSRSGELLVWDLASGKVRWRIDPSQQVSDFAIAKGRLVTAHTDGRLLAWDETSGKSTELAPVGAEITSLASSPGSTKFVAAYVTGKTVQWDAFDGSSTPVSSRIHSETVGELDEKLKREIAEMQRRDDIPYLVFSGHHVGIHYEDGFFGIYPAGQRRGSYGLLATPLIAAQFLPSRNDGSLVLLGEDGTLYQWSPAGLSARVFGTDAPHELAVSPSDDSIAVAYEGGQVLVAPAATSFPIPHDNDAFQAWLREAR